MKNTTNARGTYSMTEEYMQPQEVKMFLSLKSRKKFESPKLTPFFQHRNSRAVQHDIYTEPTSEVKPLPCKKVKEMRKELASEVMKPLVC